MDTIRETYNLFNNWSVILYAKITYVICVYSMANTNTILLAGFRFCPDQLLYWRDQCQLNDFVHASERKTNLFYSLSLSVSLLFKHLLVLYKIKTQHSGFPETSTLLQLFGFSPPLYHYVWNNFITDYTFVLWTVRSTWPAENKCNF